MMSNAVHQLKSAATVSDVGTFMPRRWETADPTESVDPLGINSFLPKWSLSHVVRFDSQG